MNRVKQAWINFIATVVNTAAALIKLALILTDVKVAMPDEALDIVSGVAGFSLGYSKNEDSPAL